MDRTRLIVGAPLLAVPLLIILFVDGGGLSAFGMHSFAIADATGLVGIVIGLVRYRPRYLAPWWCLVAVGVVQVAGDIAITVGGMIDLAGVLFVPRYPLYALALLLWARRRHPGRDAATWIDLGIVAVALALLSWVFLISPQLVGGEQHGWAAGTTLAYPVIELVLISLGLRLWLGAPRRTPSMLLLGAALVVYLAAEIVYSMFTVAGEADVSDLWNLLFLAPGPLTAAAALHPSMARLCDRVPDATPSVSGRRLFLLAVVATVPPGVLLVQYVRGGDLHAPSIAAACAGLTSLVLARMWLLVVEQRRIAVTDGLTGLNTRRRFEEALTVQFDRSRSIGVMLLDVDHFKQVNDVYGHQTGDAVLEELAHRLTRSVRAGDLVARYGGEEFAVLLGSSDRSTTAAVAERTRLAVASRPFVVGGGIELPVTVSIGVVVWDGAAELEAPADLLRAADRCLYRAKADGRNLVVTG
ncbi:GGDEF domain-containing protein [Cryptosporangium arvum]|uniref:GGDEF domain-containing protein n=1 Tax=Cryptosporangium arvum TaxID=80871 RepID=UPI0004B51DBC|nr:GGDEF domain-containing protein [Cryptosporangium arvum]